MSDNNLSVWAFVEEHYPNYSTCDEIAFSDDLQKILDGEIDPDSGAEKLANQFYGNGCEAYRSQVERDLNEAKVKIYEKAIYNFLIKNNFGE
jgi:hypothetical protein